MAGIGTLIKGAAKQIRRIGDEFDPRFDPRKKEQERLQNLEVAVEPRPLDRPQVSIADFEGHPFVTSMSDRTAAGGLLTDIRGLPLSEPVNLRGGQDFMFDYNPGQVWASGKAQASDIFSAAQMAKANTGRDPIFLPAHGAHGRGLRDHDRRDYAVLCPGQHEQENQAQPGL